MTDHEKEISSLAAEFERCRKILLALGDENRQHLILEMMQMGECGGVRVGAVTEKTHLSRPAVSIHACPVNRRAGAIRMSRRGRRCTIVSAERSTMRRRIAASSRIPSTPKRIKTSPLEAICCRCSCWKFSSCLAFSL